MKSRIFASLCILGALTLTDVSASLAADMAVKAPPRVAPASTWTGWYAGLNVGGGWGQSKNAGFANLPGVGLVPAGTDTTQLNGVIGGAQLGYNWQSGNIVFGLETDIQGAGQRGSNGFACNPAACLVPAGTIADTEKVNWFGTTRGRVGFVSGSALFYVTGGAAYGGLSATGITTLPGGTITVSKSSTQGGWTLGGGVEAALTGKWTWKVEYLYMALGTLNASVPDPFIAGATVSASSRFTDNILRAGVNLHF